MVCVAMLTVNSKRGESKHCKVKLQILDKREHRYFIYAQTFKATSNL